MKAKIDITTPAGKSLEGFPQEVNTDEEDFTVAVGDDNIIVYQYGELNKSINIHPGDKITIEHL